jgi:hypothetical protein
MSLKRKELMLAKRDASVKNEALLSEWIGERLRLGDVPRVADMLRYAKSTGMGLNRKQVTKLLQQNPVYMFNLHQQEAVGTRNYRPIVSKTLGTLHCDIGYFAKSRHYETPVTFRAGFLVAVDVVSRYVYLVAMKKSKRKEAMVEIFKTLLSVHRAAGHKHTITSISFDRETSVMSNMVQSFLADQGISFTSFKMSRSKAKHAEGCIKRVRETMARLQRHYGPKRKWWTLLGEVAIILNNREIIIQGKRIDGYTPATVTLDNLEDFLNKVYKSDPSAYAAQFNVDPQGVDFAYSVGTYVRAKLIVTSSAVIGNKRSETNLTDQVFRIVEQKPFVTKRLSIGKGYRCLNLRTGEIEFFSETDIVPTDPNVLTGDRHAPLRSI